MSDLKSNDLSNTGDAADAGPKETFLKTAKQDSDQQQQQPLKMKRGMKARSQRNRKRPRGAATQDPEYNISVQPLSYSVGAERVVVPNVFCRLIDPYAYTFATFAKARWIGRSVLDVYASEFGQYPSSYYETAIQQGKIRVSEEVVGVDYKIKGQDVLSHTVHRHEPGVIVNSPNGHIKIVAETDDMIVVDKPSTIPIHPSGAYNQNSLLPMLREAHSDRLSKLHTIQRIDRLTSGIVLIAKSSEVAKIWNKTLVDRKGCEKTYLARVKGRFPFSCSVPQIDGSQVSCGESIIDANTVNNKGNSSSSSRKKDLSVAEKRCRNTFGCWTTDFARPEEGDIIPLPRKKQLFESQATVDEWLDDKRCEDQSRPNRSSELLWLHLACPTRVANHKQGICEAGPFTDLADDVYHKTVKPAQTSFGVVRYDEDTDSTVVICRPATGRTHQIRVHLQLLGHPIANDPCYGGELFYGNETAKKICLEATKRLENGDANKSSSNGDSDITEIATISDTPATEMEVNDMTKVKKFDNEPLDSFIKRTCVWCARSCGTSIHERNMLELLVRSQGIWLHALKYKMVNEAGQVLDYNTDVPHWAN